MEDKLKILAVDDNGVILATIEEELKELYDVITVNSGARALRYLSQEKPDLILLDIQMALMDGIETLKEIRNIDNCSTIPVIMLSAKMERETVIESSKLGILDYVGKPFEPQDLRDRISRALKRSGVLPVEDKELYEYVKKVHEELLAGNVKSASLKIDEILSFKIDVEVVGRMQSAKNKLRAGDMETAGRIVARVVQMLERNVEAGEPDKLPISAGEMNARLLYVLNDLQNFKVKDAEQKLEDLMRYEIPEKVKESCQGAEDRLAEYDDGAAEELVQAALTALQTGVM